MTASCSCPPGDCHGGHTINMGMPATTLLDRVKTWMLAHDWTEIGKGPAGAMWQHTTGRKVGVPHSPIDDRDLWDGLIYRLAQTHSFTAADIEREIRGENEPVRLADEELAGIAHDPEPGYAPAAAASMAAELLALRAYATDHEGRCNTLCPRCGIELDAEIGNLTEAEAKAALAAQREPIGYAPLVTRDDGRYLVTHVGGVLDRAAAEEQATYWRDELGEATARVVELREVADQLPDQSTTQTGSTDGQAAK